MNDPTMTDEELGLEPPQAAAEKTPAEREIPPEEGIEELRAKLLSEQKRREELEAHAANATRAAFVASHDKEESDVALVQSALSQIERDAKDLKARLAQARKANDTDAEADVFLELQSLASNKQQLEQGLEALKERVVVSRQRAAAPPPPRQQDPVEELASRLTPASASWVRKHPEFASDDSKRKKMVAAHYEAESEGLAADTPQYFQFIEQRLGIEDAPEPRQTTSRQSGPRTPPPPPAPARGNSGAGNSRTMQLSPLQREMARASGLTEEEYAQNLSALRAEGKIGTTH